MVANRKVTGTAAAMPVGLGAGLGISLGITLVGSAVLSWLVDRELVAQSGIGYGVLVILLLASLLGTAAAYGKIKHRRLVVCALSGGLYFGALVCMTALFFGGQYRGLGVTALVILAGSLSVALLGLRGEKKRHPRLKKWGAS